LHPAGQPTGKDAELLARLIFAEAAGQYDRPGVYDAIAHTVLNRVGQPGFRSNLPDVIFMPKQFASVGGTLWNKAADPSTLEPENARAYARALSAANEVLSGANLTDPTHGATYFYSGKATQPPSGFFSDRIKSGVLARTEEYPPFVFWKDARQGKR
jgi:spore germination cell wall hydrolase CwlJ-like protein